MIKALQAMRNIDDAFPLAGFLASGWAPELRDKLRSTYFKLQDSGDILKVSNFLDILDGILAEVEEKYSEYLSGAAGRVEVYEAKRMITKVASNVEVLLEIEENLSFELALLCKIERTHANLLYAPFHENFEKHDSLRNYIQHEPSVKNKILRDTLTNEIEKAFRGESFSLELCSDALTMFLSKLEEVAKALCAPLKFELLNENHKELVELSHELDTYSLLTPVIQEKKTSRSDFKELELA